MNWRHLLFGTPEEHGFTVLKRGYSTATHVAREHGVKPYDPARAYRAPRRRRGVVRIPITKEEGNS